MFEIGEESLGKYLEEIENTIPRKGVEEEH